MDPEGAFHFLALILQVFFIDLLLSGDNALVVALACRSLPAAQRRQAVLVGTLAAVALRVVLTLVASLLLQVPGLKLLGGLALAVIAIQLSVDAAPPPPAGAAAAPTPRPDLGSVVATVVVADLVMSTDNVVALAAVAQGRLVVLVLGLLLSVPLLMAGSGVVLRLLARHPVLVRCGGALLGWLAGDIAVTDPIYAAGLEQQSPALGLVVPALAAVYVLMQSRIIDRSRAGAAALRPAASAPRPRAALPAAVPAAGPPADAATQAQQLAAAAGAAAHEALPGPPADRPREPAAMPSRQTGPAAGRQAAAIEPRARRANVRRRGLIGAGVLAGAGAVTFLLTRQWLPVPAESARYDCPGFDVSLYYRPGGGQRLQIATPSSRANGVLQRDNTIDWGNYHDTSKALGLVPPTRVVYADAKVLRVDGGMFENLSCVRAEAAGMRAPLP